MSCDTFREHVWALPDELTPEESEALRAHLEVCAACRAEADTRGSIGTALAAAEGEEAPGDEVLDRVRSRLAPAETSPTPVGEVMTPEELAAYLQVPVADVFENLEALPAFEFGGYVRFRRRAIDHWLEEQEQRWRRESLAASVRAASRGRD
jgi:hypothetical protein